MAEDKKQPQMMDPGAPEGSVTEIKRQPRNCWALETLIEEVRDLFPEVAYEVSGVDGRNTAHDVIFDLTTLDSDIRPMVTGLIEMIDQDQRVSAVETEDDNSRVLVEIHWWPRIQDSRETFGLADAWLILNEEDD